MSTSSSRPRFRRHAAAAATAVLALLAAAPARAVVVSSGQTLLVPCNGFGVDGLTLDGGTLVGLVDVGTPGNTTCKGQPTQSPYGFSLGSDLRSGTITIGTFALGSLGGSGGNSTLTGPVALKSGYSWPTVTNRSNFVQSGNGSMTLWYGASFINAAKATYRILNDGSITVQEPSDYLRWENQAGASLIKSGSSGPPSSSSVITVPLTNNGLIQVDAGILQITGGGTHGTGASLVTTAGSLQLGGVHSLTGAVSLKSTQGLFMDAEDLRIGAGAVVDNQAALRIRAVTGLSAPQLINHGSLATSGAGGVFLSAGSRLENHGSMDIQSAGSTAEAGSQVLNQGAFTLSGTYRSGGEFDNRGSVQVKGQWQSADPFDTSTGGSIGNSGTLVVAAGGSLVTHDLTQTAGRLTVDGNLDVYGGIVSLQGGTLDGIGVINGEAFMGGTADTAKFKPGHSPGHMTINGTLTMASNSELELQVERLANGMLAWDSVTASHITFLSGSTIHFVVGAGVATTDFQTLSFLDCGACGGGGGFPGFPGLPDPFNPGGAFIEGIGNVNVLINGAPGAFFQISDSGLMLTLAPAAAVPEPSSAGLLFSGLIGLWSLARRRLAA